MISYNDATPIQRQCVKDLIGAIVKMCQGDPRYDISVDEKDDLFILIDENLSKPSETKQKNILNFLRALSKEKNSTEKEYTEKNSDEKIITFITVVTLIESKEEGITAKEVQRIEKRVKEINSEIIDGLIKMIYGDLSDKPENVDAKVWAIMPSKVKNEWNNFNFQMQAHILNSLSIGLDEKYINIIKDFLSNKISGSLTKIKAPVIPVRLPHAFYTDKISEEIYSLEEVLEMRGKVSLNRSIRKAGAGFWESMSDLNIFYPAPVSDNLNNLSEICEYFNNLTLS